MGQVSELKRPFDVSVCLSEDSVDEIQCVDLTITEEFLVLKTVTGKERTYCLHQVVWFERD